MKTYNLIRRTVSLSDKLLIHSKIKNNVLFVGLGKTFQIWELEILKSLKLQREKAFQIDLIKMGK